jgi:hypothetical protein
MSVRSRTCMSVLRSELLLSILRLLFKLRIEESRPHGKKGGRLRSEPSAPLSAPPQVEGGQLRSRRLSSLLSPCALGGFLVGAADGGAVDWPEVPGDQRREG